MCIRFVFPTRYHSFNNVQTRLRLCRYYFRYKVTKALSFEYSNDDLLRPYASPVSQGQTESPYVSVDT